MPAGAETEGQLRAEVERRIGAELGWRVIGWTELGTGTNNRLFRLVLADGPPLVAKLYAADRWNRLGTEYPALVFLAGRGTAGVPRPYLRDEERLFGVYSFEPGERRAPADLTVEDARAAGRLAADLHSFALEDDPIGPASAACFSVADHVALIDARLREFGAFTADPACYDEVRAFAGRVDLPATIVRLIASATAGLGPDALAAALPRPAWRFSTYDFGPQNLLFHGDGVTVVDLEGAGWDDPARMVMGFVSHAGSDGLSGAAVAAFLGTYAEARRLTGKQIARFERVGRLYDVEWASVYAAAVTPAAIEPKRFGTPGFDLAAHLATCLAKLEERLVRAERGVGYRFPR
jgi:Ser/Thr protein kinase RdoA (MazF antagonist)